MKKQPPKRKTQPEPDPGHHRFAAILRLTRGTFYPYDADDSDHRATGFIFGKDERMHWTHLSFEDTRSRVRIEVRLGRTQPLTGRDFEALMSAQRDLAYGRVDYDPEERLLSLVATPTCVDPVNDGHAVRLAVKELQKAAADERLLRLVK